MKTEENGDTEKKKGMVIMMGVAKKKPDIHIKKPEVSIFIPTLNVSGVFQIQIHSYFILYFIFIICFNFQSLITVFFPTPLCFIFLYFVWFFNFSS